MQSKKRKDVDLRQLLNAKKPPPVYSIADKVASLTKNKLDDESDQDEEAELVIEVPAEDEDKEKEKHLDSEQSKNNYLYYTWLFFSSVMYIRDIYSIL